MILAFASRTVALAAALACAACIPVENEPSPYGGLRLVLVPSDATRLGFTTDDGWTVRFSAVYGSYGPDGGAYGSTLDENGDFDPSRPRACSSGTYETPVRQNLVLGPQEAVYRRVYEGECTPGLRPTFAVSYDEGQPSQGSFPSTFLVTGEARRTDGRVVRFEIPFVDPPGVHVCGYPTPRKLTIVAREATTLTLVFEARALFESVRRPGRVEFQEIANMDANRDGVVVPAEVLRSPSFESTPRTARALREPNGNVCPVVPFGTDYAR